MRSTVLRRAVGTVIALGASALLTGGSASAADRNGVLEVQEFGYVGTLSPTYGRQLSSAYDY